jgi:hypothetical protein
MTFRTLIRVCLACPVAVALTPLALRADDVGDAILRVVKGSVVADVTFD